LVDGGTDSVIFGDEPGLGTVTEDAGSIIANCSAGGDRTLLASIGFGIDHFHGISPHLLLENVSESESRHQAVGILLPEMTRSRPNRPVRPHAIFSAIFQLLGVGCRMTRSYGSHSAPCKHSSGEIL
jgi:hypothetical protein